MQGGGGVRVFRGEALDTQWDSSAVPNEVLLDGWR